VDSSLVKTPTVTKKGVHTHVWKKPDSAANAASTRVPSAPPPTVEEFPIIAKKGGGLPEQSFDAVFGKNIIEVYSEGDCWALAAYMRDAYNLPAFALITDDDPEYGEMWCHIVNQLPDGRFVDITGIYYGETIAQAWGAAYIMPADKFLTQEHLAENGIEPNEFYVVDEVGRELAELLGLEEQDNW
jgi:hypothetical protein